MRPKAADTIATTAAVEVYAETEFGAGSGSGGSGGGDRDMLL